MEGLSKDVDLVRLDVPGSTDPENYAVKLNGNIIGDVVSLAPEGVGWIGYVQFESDTDSDDTADTTSTYATLAEVVTAVVRSYQEYWADFFNAKNMGE